MTDPYLPSFTLFFLILLVAQSILFPILVPETSILSIVISGL